MYYHRLFRYIRRANQPTNQPSPIQFDSIRFNSIHQVIELEPKNERNFYKRFRVFLSKRKYAEAIKDLSRALELKPKYKQVRARERACV